MANARTLPEEFADLDQFVADWDLATEGERYAKRLASDMSVMQAFYDSAMPRLADAMTYCDNYPLHDLPDDVRSLMHVMQSLITISFAVEVWKQPRVPDSGASYVECIKEPVV
jgi:hypothetical protein